MPDRKVNAYKHLDMETKFSQELPVGHFSSIIATRPPGKLLKALIPAGDTDTQTFQSLLAQDFLKRVFMFIYF